MKLVWFPEWRCQNYDKGKSHGKHCPYCPYGWDAKGKRLLYEGEPKSPGELIDKDIVKRFLQNNITYLAGFVEISGGEPLLYKPLTEVLYDTGYQWSITSNTANVEKIRELGESGVLKRCTSWTASYHPFSGRDEAFSEAAHYLNSAGKKVRVTIVVSKHTLPILKKAQEFVQSLPTQNISWHMESHGEFTKEDREEAESIIGKVSYVAGKHPQDLLCNKTGNLMALGPDGTLYNCVTHCYSGVEPLLTIDRELKLDEISSDISWCEDDCFACCDWIKHIG